MYLDEGARCTGVPLDVLACPHMWRASGQTVQQSAIGFAYCGRLSLIPFPTTFGIGVLPTVAGEQLMQMMRELRTRTMQVHDENKYMSMREIAHRQSMLTRRCGATCGADIVL
jgi:hypothetical protein